MKTAQTSLLYSLLMLLVACQNEGDTADAYGNFEAVETTVSAQATGALQTFTAQEGQELRAGQVIGQIDTEQLKLRKAQLLASERAVRSRTPNVSAQLSAYEQQIAVQQQQLKTLQREKERAQKSDCCRSRPYPTTR